MPVINVLPCNDFRETPNCSTTSHGDLQVKQFLDRSSSAHEGDGVHLHPPPPPKEKFLVLSLQYELTPGTQRGQNDWKISMSMITDNRTRDLPAVAQRLNQLSYRVPPAQRPRHFPRKYYLYVTECLFHQAVLPELSKFPVCFVGPTVTVILSLNSNLSVKAIRFKNW